MEKQETFSLILDFETTGTDTKEARPTELGLLLVNSETWSPVKGAEYSSLIYSPDYPELSQEVEDLTGITSKELRQSGNSLVHIMEKAAEVFGHHLHSLDFIVAYNKSFDENLLREEAKRIPLGLTPVGGLLLNTPWLCAMEDVEENSKYKCRKLSHLALDHGIAVDPDELHRAMGDVILTQKLLAKIKKSAFDIYAYQQQPWIVMQALIPAPWTDGGKGKTEAQRRGYSWEVPRGTEDKYPKSWVKRIKERDLEEEIKTAPFKVVQIKGGDHG